MRCARRSPRAAARLRSESEPKQPYQFGGRDYTTFSAMQETEAVQSGNEQGEQGQKPTHQQTIGVVMTDMFQGLAGFAVN